MGVQLDTIGSIGSLVQSSQVAAAVAHVVKAPETK